LQNLHANVYVFQSKFHYVADIRIKSRFANIYVANFINSLLQT